MNSNLDNRLYNVYKKLSKSIQDENGYGGPVHHKASNDKYHLKISVSDFGDLLFTVRDLETNDMFAWEYYDWWRPVTIHTNKITEKFVKLAEELEWKDEIKRNGY